MLPSTSAGCFWLSLLAWPAVALVTDLLGVWIEPRLNIRDFGLLASNFTLPVTWVYAVVLWFRGFLLSKDRPASISWHLAVVTLPFWVMVMGVTTFFFFPFGRISDNF
jgi:hypothetical protein